MGKYMSVVVGGAVALLGFIGLANWWCDFMSVLKGSVPIALVFGGVIAVIAGISEIKDAQSSKKK